MVWWKEWTVRQHAAFYVKQWAIFFLRSQMPWDCPGEHVCIGTNSNTDACKHVYQPPVSSALLVRVDSHTVQSSCTRNTNSFCHHKMGTEEQPSDVKKSLYFILQTFYVTWNYGEIYNKQCTYKTIFPIYDTIIIIINNNIYN